MRIIFLCLATVAFGLGPIPVILRNGGSRRISRNGSRKKQRADTCSVARMVNPLLLGQCPSVQRYRADMSFLDEYYKDHCGRSNPFWEQICVIFALILLANLFLSTVFPFHP